MQPKEGRLAQHLEDRRYHRRTIPVQNLDVAVTSKPATNTSPHCTVSATYRSVHPPRYDECSGRPVPLGAAAARSAAQHEAHRIRGAGACGVLERRGPHRFRLCTRGRSRQRPILASHLAVRTDEAATGWGWPSWGGAWVRCARAHPASSDRKWNSHMGRAYRAMYPPRRKHASRSARRTAGLAATCIAATPTVRALAESSEYYRYRTRSPLGQFAGGGSRCIMPKMVLLLSGSLPGAVCWCCRPT